MSSDGTLVQPATANYKEHPGAWREIQQVVGLLLGQSDWGAPISLTSYDNDSTFAVTIQNQGTGGHLNIPSLLIVNDSGVFTGLLTATDLTVLRNTILGDAAGDSLTVNATASFGATAAFNDAVAVHADLTVDDGASATLAAFDVSNLRVLIGFATPLGSATDDMLSVIGGAIHIAANGSDAALGIRYGVLGSNWLIGATALTNPDLVFKDDSGVTRFTMGDGASAYQAIVNGNEHVTGNLVVDGTVTVTGGVAAGQPAARVYNSATISHTTSGSWQTLTFDSERYDTASLHSTSVNTSRMTAPTTGLYTMTANINFAANATGVRGLRFLLNGTTVLAFDLQATAGAGATTAAVISTDYQLTATDYIEVQGFQDSGGALNMNASANATPEFSMRMVQ